MMAYLIKEPQHTKLNMEDCVSMSETLGDAISSFLEKNDRKISYNRYIKIGMARTAAMIESRLRQEQVHFVDMKRTGLLDESKRRNLLIQIIELKEEFDDLRCRMTLPARIEMDTETRRSIFHTIGERNAMMILMDFVRIYNKWTDASAEYLILRAIREIMCSVSGSNNRASDTDKLGTAKTALAEEYDKKISEQENILHSYCEDLCDIAEELDEEYGIFDILDKLTEEADLSES